MQGQAAGQGRQGGLRVWITPHAANPRTKRPIVALMKQARASGVCVVVATQNPMDLDYRALPNAGLWCIGRLPADRRRSREVSRRARGCKPKQEEGEADLARTVQRLAS